MRKYYIKHNKEYLSSLHGYEYWSEYTNKNAYRHLFPFGWLKLKFLQIFWETESRKNNLYLEEVKKVYKD